MNTSVTRLASLGHALQRHRPVVIALQWAVVACYIVLVVVPAFMPMPPAEATITSNLRLFAQFAFWGIWWPFVILSVMLFGRMWCGVLCPEGALTEWASHHGLGRSIPRWIRWSGWPFVAFVCTTIYGQLISVYEYPQATLLILGGSTLVAMAVGFVFGRGKRVWCRYLCPVSGVFGLLAKVAPMHYRTDAEQWVQHTGPRTRVNCAPLLDMRHLSSASDCHACGRCSGHRNAIALSWRSPCQEIVSAPASPAQRYPARLLVFGILGLALGAFQWTVSPIFVSLKQAAAQWLINHEHYALLQDNAPWWLLTHVPEAGDVFNWLDGLAILAYLALTTAVIGGSTWLALMGAARVLGAPRQGWSSLAMALVPLGGTSLFLGLSMLTLTQLRADGVVFSWMGWARALVLCGGLAWSAWLGLRLIGPRKASIARRVGAGLCFAVPLTLVGASWIGVFY
ncbi:MAG: 4Fe-4S binding protein [Burkholderiales bacterium]|nr:4Fe-4S binding protein [Burkholderiales bacterium]